MSAWADTLDELMRSRASSLFGYAYVLTGDAAEAEDLLQDALVRTFRSNRRSGSLNEAHVYVKRAISSAFIDGHRRTQTRPQRATGDDGNFADASAVTPGPENHVTQSVDLHQAILTLPPKQRACVVLRFLEDKTVASIAAELSIADGTVKRHLHDAVATLRTRVTDVDFDAPPRDTVAVHSTEGAQR